MEQLLKLIQLFAKFGVKPSEYIGKATNITPITKPMLTKKLNLNTIAEDILSGKIDAKTIQNEIRELAPLATSNQLNSLEIQRATQTLEHAYNVMNPPAPVSMTTKQPIIGEGLEALRQTAGQTARPGTTIGNVESRVNQIKQLGREMEQQSGKKPTLDEILKEYGQGQTNYAEQHRQGLVRATSREIIERDLAEGKLKGVTRDDLNTKDPIDILRTHYGEDALEQLDSLSSDFGKLRTEKEAADLARSKYELEPKPSPVKESYTKEEMDEMLKNAPEYKGSFEPEEKAKGGTVGIDYLLGF